MAAKAGIIYETMRPSHKMCKSPYLRKKDHYL